MAKRVQTHPTVITRRHSLQALTFEHRALGDTVGLVPTMGALHDGHLALIGEARNRADVVIVSIFVNPRQFELQSDLAAYPRTLEEDLSMAAQAGADIVFAPGAHEMYPPSFSTSVTGGPLTRVFEGKSRKGHFDGMLTVVTKLFLLSQPHFAVFGEKDFQQLLLVRHLVRDLNLPVEIVPMPVIRETDGLALSSRNRRLSERDRAQATCLVRALCAAQDLVSDGEVRAKVLREAALAELAKTKRFEVDYVEIVHPSTLEKLKELDGPSRCLIAGRMGSATKGIRLIDNGPLFPPRR